MREVLGALETGARERGGPLPAGGPDAVRAAWAGLLTPGALLPDRGVPGALGELTRALARTAADPADPACAAHLHVPPLAVAVAADLAVNALNPSLDSWDQAPGGVELEQAVVRTLTQLAGLPNGADGTFTTGGSESNLMGLLLARDRAEGTARRVVFCSDAAHFSVRRACALLGAEVRPVESDRYGRMDPRLLDWALADCRDLPVCVVATAGTTDLGAIDPLDALADVAARHRVPLHVDAAYGGGALFSRQLAPLLAGLGRADSVSLDLHKLGWQPVAAGVFLVRDRSALQPLELHAAYLNPEADEEAGLTSLLGRSLRTTRRPDAFKVAVTLRTLGREGLGALVDHCHALARHTAQRISESRDFELYTVPMLTTVVFRYGDSDEVNDALRRRLLAEGTAVVGRTEIGGAVWLKLTLLNPQAGEADLDRLLERVRAAGAAAAAQNRHR
ncbi:pyridoxal phosphate-dependent decarboxylase family protein [Streptacidiphilus monticola]|uniref:Pyridoxal phosphate-dependent decarboxylase family protein n=1 Tax=Streptacidiphilus monticola TaxID=2161674 RepID=A0ABW1G371_9ACTN